jgi:uncharacterized protein (DUF169 family)
MRMTIHDKTAPMTTTLEKLLDLRSAPVTIAFRASAPEGVTRIAQSEPAGCGYWRRAAAGEVFFTEPADHKSCPVGAHTHHVELTPEEKKELEGLVGVMVGLEYLKPSDVPQIATMQSPFRGAVYAPLGKEPVSPDVVLVRGNARQLMLLAEASQAAGVSGAGPTMGRPTCAVLPEAVSSQKTSASFGCIGNRVYTGAGDDEAYFAIPGAALAAVEERLAVMVNANRELEKFHRGRLPRA